MLTKKEQCGNIQFWENNISLKLKKSGGDGAVDTPVPIPNTEVKHRSGEDIRKDKIASRRAFLFSVQNAKIWQYRFFNLK